MKASNGKSNHFYQGPEPALTYSLFRDSLHKDWQLPENSKALLRRYFIRKWHTANFLALIKDGCLNYEGFNYQVEWVGGKVVATSSTMVSLSFRLPYDSIFPVVMVKQTLPSYYSDITKPTIHYNKEKQS